MHIGKYCMIAFVFDLLMNIVFRRVCFKSTGRGQTLFEATFTLGKRVRYCNCNLLPINSNHKTPIHPDQVNVLESPPTVNST